MEAVILLQRCNQMNRVFANRVEKRGNDWYKTWAFQIDERRAKSEGYDRSSIRGMLYTAQEHPGCPYCGSRASVHCNICHKLSCWHEETEMPCKWCGTYMTGIRITANELEFSSGNDL